MTRLAYSAAQAFDPESRPRLRSVTVAHFLQMEIPEREHVLTPIVPQQGLAMLYSKRGVGKTYTALGIAVAVATGSRFLRWSAAKARRVLYVDGEMPAATMRERLASIIAGQPPDAPDMPSPDFLRIITPDLQSEPLPDLSGEDGQAAIEAELQGAELLILDNLSTLCRGGKENEAESWLPVQVWALSLRRRGVSVLFVHHAGKGGAQRGTSRREDVLDTVIALKHSEEYSPTDGARFEIHYEKARGIHGEDARAFEARMETRDGTAIWTMGNVIEPEMRQAADLCRQGIATRYRRGTGDQ